MYNLIQQVVQPNFSTFCKFELEYNYTIQLVVRDCIEMPPCDSIGPEGHFRMMIKDQNDEVGIGRHSKREFLRRNVIRLNLLSSSQAPFGNRNPLNEDQNDGQNNKPQLWRGATVDCRVVLDQQSASPRRFTCLLE